MVRQPMGNVLADEATIDCFADENVYEESHPTEFGGADGIRTHDLLDAIEARSQLRHGPTSWDFYSILRAEGQTAAAKRKSGGGRTTWSRETSYNQW